MSESKKAPGPDIFASQLPDGRTIVYPARPGIVLRDRPDHRHTGACDFEWHEAQQHIGDHFTPREVRAGWPHRLSPMRLANLQFPHEKDDTGIYPPSDASARQNWVSDALQGLCERGQIKGELIHRTTHLPPPAAPMQWLEYWIDPQTFLDWLAGHGLEPSRFIAAWCKANGVKIEGAAPTPRADAAPQAAAPEAKAAPEWQTLAQKRAREIIREYKQKGWYPPQGAIADTIASEFRRDSIMGSDGKPLSGATIKRHALKGISSAIGRQLSTSPRRGK